MPAVSALTRPCLVLLSLLLTVYPVSADPVGRRPVDRPSLVHSLLGRLATHGGRTYLVSASGDGYFRTIQEAVDRAKPGDMVLVRKGIYREKVTVTADGTTDRPIRLVAEGDSVVIDGEGERICIDIRGDNVVVDGFRCRNAKLEAKHPNDGTIVLFGSHGAVVRNTHCSGASDGYKVADISVTSSTGFLIQNNRCASKISHSIDIGWESTDGVVEHNELTGSYSATYVHAMAHRTTVRYNVASEFMGGGVMDRDPWHGSGVVCRDNVGSHIHHNLFVRPQASGVLLYDFLYEEHGPDMPGADQPNEGHRVHHNTVIGPSLFGIELSGNVEDCRVYDNLVTESTRAALRFYHVPETNTSNEVGTNGLWDCPVPVVDDGGSRVDPGTLLIADPLFASPEQGDYRPADRSLLTRFGAFAEPGDREEE